MSFLVVFKCILEGIERIVWFLLRIVRFLLRKINNRYYRKLQFSNLKELIAEKYSIKQYEYINSNEWYSNAYTIKKYAGFEESLKLPFAVEHGTKYDDDITEYEIDTDLPAVLATGGYRIQVYKDKKIPKDVYSIGPYIKYAQPLLSEHEFKNRKRKLGKVLLFMPCHSDVYQESSHNDTFIFDEINKRKIKEKFDTLLVCLHWYNIKKNLFGQYKELGWTCVTAGHETNHLFLSRLRSIIELSDAVISDGIGTHIGFALTLNKPVSLYKVNFIVKNVANLPHITDESLTNQIDPKLLAKFYEVFAGNHDKITQEQLDLVEPYYGLNNTLSKEDFKQLILKYDKKYKEILQEKHK